MPDDDAHSARGATRDAAILLVEMQPPIIAFSHTQPEADIRKATTAAVRLARAFDLPLIASVVRLDEGEPTLVEELEGVEPMPRRTVSAFADGDIARAVRATGCRSLAVGGVSSEIAVLRTALDAIRAGYEVHLLVDLCGGLSPRTEASAFEQARAAGAVSSNVSSFFAGMVSDMDSAEWRAVAAALGELWSWGGGA